MVTYVIDFRVSRVWCRLSKIKKKKCVTSRFYGVSRVNFKIVVCQCVEFKNHGQCPCVEFRYPPLPLNAPLTPLSPQPSPHTDSVRRGLGMFYDALRMFGGTGA